MASPPFRFKKFIVEQAGVVHPVGTDSVLLGAWAACPTMGRALDIGTGTGIIALMLAQRSGGNIRIDAVEIDPETAACAQRNIDHSPWAETIRVYTGSVQDFSQKTNERYDVIASNPPFFTETVVAPETRRQLGRNTGSLPFSDLIETAKRLLKPDGCMCVVLPVQEGNRLIELATLGGLYCNRETIVYSKPEKPAERLLLQFGFRAVPFWRDRLCIYVEERVYSTDFQALTKDFYLHFP